MKLVNIVFCIFFANNILANESKIFCRYNHKGVTKVYDPAYFDEDGNVVFAKTIEEYAKVLGPTWYGVSWCDNSTMVNSIGIYYDVSSIQEKLRKRSNSEDESKKDNNNDEIAKDKNEIENVNPYVRGKNTIEESKQIIANYVDAIYDKLKHSNKQCIPLVSNNPQFNPYHKSLIIGINDRVPNIRHATGGIMKLPNSINNIINNINDVSSGLSQGFTNCAAVSNCKGCTVVCDALITFTNERQYSITNSEGQVISRSIGNIESNTDTLTDEISNTIEIASTLSHSDSITQSESDANTNSLELAVSIAHLESKTDTNDTNISINMDHSEANIHGVTEDDTHAITNTTGVSTEKNWSGYKEKSGTKEYSYLSKEDYDYYNNQYEPIGRIDYINDKTSYKNKNKRNENNYDFILYENNNTYNNGTQLEKRFLPLAALVPIVVDFAVSTASRVLVKQGLKQVGKYIGKKMVKKIGKKASKEAAKSVSKKVKRGKKKDAVDGINQTGQTTSQIIGNIQESNNLDFQKDSFDKTYAQTEKWNNDNYELTKLWNDKNYNQTEKWNESNFNLTRYWNEDNRNLTETWNWKNYNQNEKWNENNYQLSKDTYELTKKWNQKNYDQTETWNKANYKQTEKWNQKNYDQTEYWNGANYQQTEAWNLKNYQQTEHWNQKNFDQTEIWNQKNFDQTEIWNWKNFNQTEYWNRRNEQTEYKMANFNYDIQEYFTDRQERADLVMALSGTRTTSNTEVEGSSKGGSKINSKEDSVYNSHSHSVMDQKETSNGYSIGYTLGHGEASTKEDSVSDTISNLLSNTYTSENGWTHEDSESNTESNGRTFGNSYSNSIMNEISLEEAKSISNETIYSKVESNSVSYQIRQSISDQPDNEGCYSYEVTPNILSEATVWACGTTNAKLGDHVKFYTSEYSKYETNKYIINKTGCSYNEDSRNFRILENDIYNLKMDIQRGVKNNMVMGDILTAPDPISYLGESIDYSGSYISTINSSSDPSIRKPLWFFGILETGELALCKDKFDTNHIQWSAKTITEVLG